ncbi:MAG: hypothetical protein WA967_02695, partial [Microbacterium sp.]
DPLDFRLRSRAGDEDHPKGGDAHGVIHRHETRRLGSSSDAVPQGLDLLHRDCVNICDWFTRRRLERDPDELFAELLAASFG